MNVAQLRFWNLDIAKQSLFIEKLDYTLAKIEFMRYFNICSKRTISTLNGDKHIYQKIGFIKTKNPHKEGLWYMQLYQNPNSDYHVFPSNTEELPVIE